MKIAVFGDALSKLPDYRTSFAGSDHQLLFFVCNNGRLPIWRFLLAQTYLALRSYRPADWLALASDWLGRRLVLSVKRLGDPDTLAALQALQPDIGLHVSGVIYREDVISRCRLGILNAHIGHLPEFRGRSVMEWSMLCGHPTGITVFFLDTGIDTGQDIVLFRPVTVPDPGDLAAAKTYLFSLHADFYRMAVDLVCSGAPVKHNDVSRGKRFYEMSMLFRQTLERQCKCQP